MERDFWFYTLSAIPQTLAAIIALSATFMIFKFNFFQQNRNEFLNEMIRFLTLLKRNKTSNEILKFSDDEISGILEKINELNPNDEHLKVEEKHYKKYYNEMETRIAKDRGQYRPTPQRIYDYLVNQKNYFNELKRNKKNIIQKLKYSLIPISITISLSLIFLPLFDLIIKCNLTVIYVILAIIISLAVINIAYTAWCIFKISVE